MKNPKNQKNTIFLKNINFAESENRLCKKMDLMVCHPLMMEMLEHHVLSELKELENPQTPIILKI